MHTFEFIRPARSGGGDRHRRAVENRAAGRGRAVPRRRDDAARPDEAERRDAHSVLDINRLPLDKIEATSDGGLKIGADGSKFRSCESSDGAARLCRAVAGDSRRRIGADSQHGNDGRQPAPANPLRVFPRHRDALQQARARHRLPGHHRQQPHAGHSRHERTLHRHQPLGHVRGDGGVGGDDPRPGPKGITRHSHSAIFIFCPATRRIARRCSNRAT